MKEEYFKSKIFLYMLLYPQFFWSKKNRETLISQNLNDLELICIENIAKESL